MLAGSETLFIIDDIIADKSLNKRKYSLLDLAAFSRHHNHYLWFVHLRSQAKAIFVWYPEVDELTYDKLDIVRSLLKESKNACLYI